MSRTFLLAKQLGSSYGPVWSAMPGIRYENPKGVARIKDVDIDFSDIPELTDEWFAHAVRGKFYRPVKEIVSIRLDKDVLAFYRSQGAGYQTRINDTLRAAMQGALSATYVLLAQRRDN
jgi:uncharacterized protein (DUF4415 family)